MRRAFLLVGGVVIVGIAAVFACSFPSPDFAANELFKDGGFLGSETSTSDGPNPTTIVDAGNPFDGACSIKDPTCDCDDDGDKAIACDGGDCNDRDPRVRSTLTQFLDFPPTNSGSKPGDWNCDGITEQEFEGGLDCASLIGIATLDGDAAANKCTREGFFFHPECSEPSRFAKCRRNGSLGSSGFNCAVEENSVIEDKKQRCR